MNLFGRGAAIIILLTLLLSNVASAYYVPAEYRDEAKTIKNDVQMYQFAVKYQDQHWAKDILLQLSINYTNSATLSELIITMEKYIKRIP